MIMAHVYRYEETCLINNRHRCCLCPHLLRNTHEQVGIQYTKGLHVFLQYARVYCAEEQTSPQVKVCKRHNDQTDGFS